MSVYSNHGERVVVGQRLIQSASDLFIGWTCAKAGFDVYIRQLRDMKMSAMVEGWDFDTLRTYTRICAWALARQCRNFRVSERLESVRSPICPLPISKNIGNLI
jgi:hypothetical protein